MIEGSQNSWTLAVHGGTANLLPALDREDQLAHIHGALRGALLAGATILSGRGNAVDAVEAAVQVLEDDDHFNAGRGAVFTAGGRQELDAAIMDGRTRLAGAVAGITRTKNPVRLARAVMDHSRFVMLHGDGAEEFGRQHKIEQVDPVYFFSKRNWEQLQEFLRSGDEYNMDIKYGTVGAVARDASGSVAAATSTGGMTGKRWGRIGDSPLIGAGTYAEPGCAVSCTGTGEYFIRVAAAHEVCARVRLMAETVQQAANTVIRSEVNALGGQGGAIAVGAHREAVWSFSTQVMFRGRISEGGVPTTAIFRDES